MRGQLTQEIQKKAKNIIGREISLRELRLMPYIQYVMLNEQRIDIQKINGDEREVLSLWRKEGFIEGGASQMQISKKFWDFISEIIFIGYIEQTGGQKIE